eukprot:gene24551-31971_t
MLATGDALDDELASSGAIGDPSAINVFENGNQLGYIDRVVVSWSKFCSLTDLLEYTLTDIAEWLPKLKFSSFTSKQLSSLIIALFEDSPKRQSVLAAINEVKASK